MARAGRTGGVNGSPHTFRTGLVGFGLAGEYFHAPLIDATPGLSLAVIATSNDERAARAAAAYPHAAIVADAASLLRAAPELVVIATPNRTHAPLARDAILSGAAVVIDKPISPTRTAALELVELAKRERRLLTVYQNRRWDGDFLTVRRLLAEGRLGDIRRFESRFERWRPAPKPGWRQDADPEAAGGVLFDLGSHLIDQALLLFGEVRQVFAELDARNAGTMVDDDAFIALTHVSGTRSHLWMSTVAAASGPRFRLLGSRAAFTKHGLDAQEVALRSGARPGGDDQWGADPRTNWGTLTQGGRAEEVPTERGAYPEFYRLLVEAMRSGGAPPVDPRDAAAGVQIIEAARESAMSQRVVTLQL